MKQRVDLTFKHNRTAGRHGWLRLTPAYSVKLVGEILDRLDNKQIVVDPFSGTGTTAVVAAERGHECDAFDINPFLIWLGEAKARNYSEDERSQVTTIAHRIARTVPDQHEHDHWVPPISAVDRWWTAGHLRTLAAIYGRIERGETGRVADLLKIAFCRVMIDWSNAAFNHQSMSFREPPTHPASFDQESAILADFVAWADRIAADVVEPLRGRVRFLRSDSRSLEGAKRRGYTALITSPPYPNRMSYVRELRPYMYWLGFLCDARAAGELDWQAIGGTWGCATSRVGLWKPKELFERTHPLHASIRRIARNSELLANYVHKYFEDMAEHFDALVSTLADGAELFYIVGNSKFYDVVLAVEDLYADLMVRAGLRNVSIHKIRKRNSKKELFEFVVTGSRGNRSRRFAGFSSNAPRPGEQRMLSLE